MFKTILIDDQDFCSEILKDMLEQDCPDVEVVAVCTSGKEGIKAIKKYQPDLIFLDVEMPEMTGFEMLQKIREKNFEVIFTTSFDKYSIQAIRFSALDYLLKPVVKHELIAAIERINKNRGKYFSKQFGELIKNLSNIKRTLSRVALPSSDGLIFIDIDEIIYCESDSNYTTFFLNNKEKLVVTKTLKEVERLLEENQFFRIHNSYLVNIGHIRKYVRGNAGYVVMSDGTNLNIGRNRKDAFLDQFARL
jgi:two-component system LytT family response regulator